MTADIPWGQGGVSNGHPRDWNSVDCRQSGKHKLGFVQYWLQQDLPNTKPQQTTPLETSCPRQREVDSTAFRGVKLHSTHGTTSIDPSTVVDGTCPSTEYASTDDGLQAKFNTKQGMPSHPQRNRTPTWPFVWSRLEIACSICLCIYSGIHCYGTLAKFSASHGSRIHGVVREVVSPYSLRYYVFMMIDSIVRWCTWNQNDTAPRVSLGQPIVVLIDNYDQQWRDNRQFLHILFGGAVIHLVVSHFLRSYSRTAVMLLYKDKKNDIAQGGATRKSIPGSLWLWYQVVVGGGMMCYLHGSYCLVIFMYVLCNFAITRLILKSRSVGRYTGIGLLWTMNVGGILVNGLIPFRFAYLPAPLGPLMSFLDAYSGPYRWYDAWRLVSLKMISYGMDMFWATHPELDPLSKQKDAQKPIPPTAAYVDSSIELKANSGKLVGQKEDGVGDGPNAARCEVFSNDDSSGGHPYLGSSNGGTVSSSPNPVDYSYRGRQRNARPTSEYNCLLRYLSYIFYCPLYIAGPTTTFNAWSSHAETAWYDSPASKGAPDGMYMSKQSRCPFSCLSTETVNVTAMPSAAETQDPSYTIVGTSIGVAQIAKKRCEAAKSIGIYFLRWLLCVMLMEVHMRYFYINALCTNVKNSQLWNEMSVGQVLYGSVQTLFFIWLKFVIIWRFFRLWALADGVESPENLNRCVFNNYSTEQFWRSWHRSFNQWLVRYIFVPVGGSRRGGLLRWINVTLVFMYVAIWHEIELKLLAWAGVISIFILPEFVLKAWASNRKSSPGLRVSGATTVSGADSFKIPLSSTNQEVHLLSPAAASEEINAGGSDARQRRDSAGAATASPSYAKADFSDAIPRNRDEEESVDMKKNRRSTDEDIRERWYFKYICVFAGAVNIFILCLSNLIGYSFGKWAA
eukprot:GHVT01024727.1.p1 GENE.GHVT01024727.1~~GHVT01024727.1.p1  ORF type:complete len:905 (-),score=34.11 GHVT01024727.1:149-2863(-)